MSTPTPPPENPNQPGQQRPAPAPDQAPAAGSTPDAPPAGSGRPGNNRRTNPLQDLPETIRLFFQVWLVILGLEVIHQILGVIMGLLDTSALEASVRESLSPEQDGQVSDSLISGAAIAGVVVMGIIAIALMGLLLWMNFLVKNQSRHAPLARRMLLVFGFYFAFRILLIFLMTPGGSELHVAWYAVDGSLQIIVGVAAVLSLVLCFRRETLKWTGELPGDGPGDGRPPVTSGRDNHPDSQEK